MRPRGAAEAAKDDVVEEESIFVRLTSRLAAEEVNELFENYIESVPAFDRSLADSFEQGFDEGYSAGYLRGFEDGAAAAKRCEWCRAPRRGPRPSGAARGVAAGGRGDGRGHAGLRLGR